MGLDLLIKHQKSFTVVNTLQKCGFKRKPVRINKAIKNKKGEIIKKETTSNVWYNNGHFISDREAMDMSYKDILEYQLIYLKKVDQTIIDKLKEIGYMDNLDEELLNNNHLVNKE